MVESDPESQRVESDRASRVHADQVAFDRGINRSVKLDAADGDASVCRVDNVTRAGCGATNCDSVPNFHVNSSCGRADRRCSGGIGADIIPLHKGAVAVVLNAAEATVGRDDVARAGQRTTDNGSACASVSVHHEGGTITHDCCTIGIYADKIACYDIVVATDGDEDVARISREAESLDRGTGTIAGQSASQTRAKADHLITSRVTNDLDLDLCVIANCERVRVCPRLRVAINDHWLAEPKTKITRSAETISKSDCANVRRWITARIARRDVERDEIRSPHWRRISIRRINGLAQRATCAARRTARVGCGCYGERHRRRRRWSGCWRYIR